jgi:opacity protein-like surface antigen
MKTCIKNTIFTSAINNNSGKMKQKKILIFLILISLISDAMGQKENFLGLSFGGAIPQGSFSEDNFKDSTNGYANTGFVFAFDAAWFPDDYLGVGATVTFASNNPDKNKYLDDLSYSIYSKNENIGNFAEENIVLDYGVWKYLNMFIGPNITVPAGKFNFDARLMGGVSFAWKPFQTIDINYPEEGSFSRKIEGKAVPAFGFSFGGGVRYALKSGLVLRLAAEYANCKPKFEYIDEVVYDQEQESFVASEQEVEMPIKNIHIGIGIAYNFEL